jgi:hypothetical protein
MANNNEYFETIITSSKKRESKVIPIFEFNPMTEFPKVNPESEGAFSVQVLLYDIDDTNNVYIGHYDFELKIWLPYSETECQFACWCYPPLPDAKFIQSYGRVVRHQINSDVIADFVNTHVCDKFKIVDNKFVCSQCGKSRKSISS